MIGNNRFEVSYFLAHEILSRFLVRDDVRRQVEILKAEADAEGAKVIHEKLQFEHRLRFDVVEGDGIVTDGVDSLKYMYM